MCRNTDSFRYFGVIFDSPWRFIEHVDSVLLRAKKAFGMYSKMLSGKRGLSPKVRLVIYGQVIRPIISHAFPIWFGISSHQMERLRLAERRILRHCLGMRAERNELGAWTTPSVELLYNVANIR